MKTPDPHDYIGVFDSGIGGLTVANAITTRLPKENLLYFGDAARAPYGLQSPQIIQKYCREITEFLLAKHCKCIVVACNTASAAAIEELRNTWPTVPFVGMEPAVKPAALTTQSGRIGVLATLGTISSERFFNLKSRFARHIEVFSDPCIGLVELIEGGKMTSSQTTQLLESILHPMLEKGVDTIVLGCTHYPFVMGTIQQIAGQEIQVIDPAPAIARQVKKVLTERGLLQKEGGNRHQFFTSGKESDMLSAARNFFHQPQVQAVTHPIN